MVRSGVFLSAAFMLSGFFATVPTSTSYTLKTYDLGGGGGGSAASASYGLNGQLGSQTGASATSASYGLGSGDNFTKNSNVPPAPTLSNPSNEYSRLKLVIDTGSNPSDATFAIAISSDNFATTQFVKADTSIGSSLAFSDYQTYASWGGASGFWITGLSPSTNYKVKVKALQGAYTGSIFGPATAAVATVSPTLSFGITTTLSGVPPYAIGFSSLNPGTVYDGDADILLTLSTNAVFGGSVYIRDANTGLQSAAQSYTVASVTTDLSTASNGYGAIVTATGQSSGGPINAVAPYNSTADNVGQVSGVLQTLASTTSSLSAGTITLRFKAKTDATVPGSTDYSDAITLVAAMTF